MAEEIDLLALDLAVADGSLDKDLVKEASKHLAWGPRASNVRMYGDKQRLVAYDEHARLDNRQQINDITRNISIVELGVSPRRYQLRGQSLDASGRARDKKFFLIELLRLQELMKELVSQGRADLLPRVSAGWTLGDYNLMADFIETDKAIKGIRSSVEVGGEIKDDQIGKVMIDHRVTFRPVLEAFKNQSEGWKAVWEAHKKAVKGLLDPEEIVKLKTGKTLLEEKWTYASVDGDIVKIGVNSREPGSILVWANDTFKTVAGTPDLEYYAIRLTPDNTSQDLLWTKEDQLERSQGVGQSSKMLKRLEGTGIKFSPLDLIRQSTMIGEIYQPNFGRNKGTILRRAEVNFRDNFAHSSEEHKATGIEAALSFVVVLIALLFLGAVGPAFLHMVTGIEGPRNGAVLVYALGWTVASFWVTSIWHRDLSKSAVSDDWKPFWLKLLPIGIGVIVLAAVVVGWTANVQGNNEAQELINSMRNASKH